VASPHQFVLPAQHSSDMGETKGGVPAGDGDTLERVESIEDPPFHGVKEVRTPLNIIVRHD